MGSVKKVSHAALGGGSRRKTAGATGKVPPNLPEPRRPAVLASAQTQRVPTRRIDLEMEGERLGMVALEKERRSFAKGPTSAQFTAMAGAMYNALERLREFSIIMKRSAERNCGWIQPFHLEDALTQVDAAANILRVGLKVRFQKERQSAIQAERGS